MGPMSLNIIAAGRTAQKLLVLATIIPLLAAVWWFAPGLLDEAVFTALTGPLAADGGRRIPIYSVFTDEKRVAISFDAAWGADKTLHLLDILDEYGIKTTFFLVSFWMEKYPDETVEIMARGHEIGLHSATHPDFTALSREQMRAELKDNHDITVRLTNIDPRLFRPPFGAYNNRVLETVEDELGYTTIQWSVDSLDWKNVTPDDIVNRVLGRIHPGAIVLFHNNAESTPAALPRILSALTADGWSIVPVSELLHPHPYTVDHQGRQVPRRPPPQERPPRPPAPGPDNGTGAR